MKTLLVIVVVQSLNLVVFWWFNRVAWVRILALKQQLTVYKRKAKKPRLRNRDRLFKPYRIFAEHDRAFSRVLEFSSA